MSTASTPRPLTTDEKKAAEAAFRGEPLDSKWSASARAIYEGITKVMGPRATLFEDTPVEQVATRSEVEPTAQTDQVAEASSTPVCPLYAVAMGDQTVSFSLTILLANEVSAVIRPTGN